jgi:hypothetical protein
MSRQLSELEFLRLFYKESLERVVDLEKFCKKYDINRETPVFDANYAEDKCLCGAGWSINANCVVCDAKLCDDAPCGWGCCNCLEFYCYNCIDKSREPEVIKAYKKFGKKVTWRNTPEVCEKCERNEKV